MINLKNYMLALAGSIMFPANATFAASIIVQPDTLIETPHSLKEAIVSGFGPEQNLKTPEMGHVSLNENMINRQPVMFGEPDIVKSLQALPGVSQGVEGFTSLLVRGGDNDQNLFLYQGLPLYHVSHIGGIFSSFNVATINRVDFYKSSFPAIYGGRISSITDIKTKRPDFEQFHGRINIGLLSANVFLTAPIVKNKTAFSVGVRRSWIDVVSIPTLAIINSAEKKKGKRHIANYAFMDFNARIDHKLNDKISTYLIGYYGHDNFKIGQREFEANDENSVGVNGQPNTNSSKGTHFYDENTNKLSWGNWGVLGALDWLIGKGLLTTSLYYSDYSSTYSQKREYQSDTADQSTYGFNLRKTDNSIHDIGIKINYTADFSHLYQLHVGTGYVLHDYLPEQLLNKSTSKNFTLNDDNHCSRIKANEAFIYADNTFNFTDAIALNLGLRSTIYNIQNHEFASIEPRTSIKYAISDNYSIKLGYARMTQYVQQISSNYINLPTDLWQPITKQFEPLYSNQYAIGLYGALPYAIYFSAEGWYKQMNNLLEYREGISVLNPQLNRADKLTNGKGWSYGIDLSFTKEVGSFTGTIGYGLMWNWRKFSQLNHGVKFPAKFDNRHKININAAYKLNEKVEFNAGWTYMTGNRLTLSMYNYDIPGSQFPDAPTVGPPGYGNEIDGIDYYSSRNNVRMPAYHRLDIAININKKLKKGRKAIWNVSLYNAYCHMNAITIQKDNENNVFFTSNKDKWHRAFKTLSFIPTIPSVSYTYIF